MLSLETDITCSNLTLGMDYDMFQSFIEECHNLKKEAKRQHLV